MDADEARRLLGADDTAVVEDAATRLVYAKEVGALALVCEALATTEDDEVGDTLLWVLSPAWKSGEVDVVGLLEAVELSENESARRGADIAIRWLGLRP